ncbi:hypothetical protein HDF16_005992 [Granulicella aggregans]|uniref:Uncharacterized protein n=1 Tax=Granulicella aggregans TaxID=474949 RepID=A0A7W7ZL65_9BACT|nr:hypothetical protein [Granulicella aggregans]MBB5061256.1 hypothetical protein [Granulicella aggregans]
MAPNKVTSHKIQMPPNGIVLTSVGHRYVEKAVKGEVLEFDFLHPGYIGVADEHHIVGDLPETRMNIKEPNIKAKLFDRAYTLTFIFFSCTLQRICYIKVKVR